jgi:signal transduction histidine kinase
VISVLVKFSRMVSETSKADDIMPLLVGAVVERAGVGGAAVLRVDGGSLVMVASSGLPASVPPEWSASIETIGPELGERLVLLCQPAFATAHVLPIVSSGDLYGVLVLLLGKGAALEAPQLELVTALADLAALSFGKAIQYAELARSYAELRASREAMARTEKLRVLGQMAAGVSHDIKNILNPLALQLQLARRRLDDRAAILEVLDRMSEVIRSGVDVLERLREFSQQQPIREAESVDVNHAVATALELTRPRLVAVTLREEIGAPPPVRARGSELITAVVNLILNATEAGARTITVRTGADATGGFVEVADDGPGMPPEVEAHIYEPFFTTKSEGTGLGLAMIYAFVERHRGKLGLTTGVGKGTTFRIAFPGT